MTQTAVSGRAVSGRALSTGIAAAAWLLVLAGAAQAQQGYYPQAGNSPVTVNYGALTPYAAPGYQPYGAQPYDAQPYATTSQPRSVFTPQAVAPAYPAPVYGVPAYTPVYATPSSQFLAGQIAPVSQPARLNPITYNAPVAQPPFIAPYGNPAYAAQMAAQMQGGMNGLPNSTPQSYLNVPGQAPVALMGVPQPGAKPFDPNNLQPKTTRNTAAAVESTAVEEAAAAQVAAVEAQLESGPAPSAPLPEPTPPEAPAEIPANVPSPAASADVAAAAAPAAPAAATASTAEAIPAETAVIEPPTEGAAETQTAAVEPEAAAEEAATEEIPADTGGAAALPAGGTRIVFEAGADELPAGAGGDLDALAQKMMSDESIKVQVLAYSSSIGDNESQARRKALSRGLEVRKYLIGKGVRSNRIDVRALGSKSEGSPADRVDIVPAAG